MGTDSAGPNVNGLTERQQKWFASVQASLERDTGRSLEAWVEIARTCPETKPRARAEWLKARYGLGVNRAAQVLSAAFPQDHGWDTPAALEAALWTDAETQAILDAVRRQITASLDGVVCGQRKGFTAFSRTFQFAALKPHRNKSVTLGLALPPDTSPRLAEPRNEGWSERLKSKAVLTSPADVDGELTALLKAAWDAS